MGLFSIDKPKITKEELHRAISRVPGLELKERKYLEDLFQNDVNEAGQFKGIDREELEEVIQDLHENRAMHLSLTDQEIDKVKVALERML